MRLRQQSGFSFVRTEGAILPADLLSRIQAGDAGLGGLRAEDYHLLAGERLNEAISRSWNRMLGAWASFQAAYANLPPGDPAIAVTREKLLLPLFDELHYGRLNPTKALEANGKSYPVSHGWRRVPIHLVGYGIKLDTRTPGVAGAARYSPHGMMQELLNRSDDHLWGFVSNGVILRILRDNASLTRLAFVEFNLESIFDGEAYADFALLWLLCHQSRVESDRPDEFWLERWSQTARTEGARALDRLRDGVEQAIRALGRGFIAHPANQSLREGLRQGDLSSQDYYRQLLRLVYRLIFLFAAEDRGLLFPPEVSAEVRARYRGYYSTSRLRSLAAHRRGTAHPDLYRGLLLVMRKLGDPEGCPELGLPALGSFLWSAEAAPVLEACQIANHDLLAAVRHLAFSEESGVRRPIDYRNLGAEELGSVYEALLELNPEINLEGKTFELKAVGGSERKSTGSYYTPSSLIQQLLDTALDPVIEEAASKPNPQDALLGLKVCDPACGSGHFLVAAAHRIARRLASVRTGDEEPSVDAQLHALRDVIRHCIYGVDINPLAVELCKVNLWLEALEPGKPLSFLDHKIQSGNSLLGATPALLAGGIPDDAFEPIEGDNKKFASSLKKQNEAERPSADLEALGIESAQATMFDRLVTVQRPSYSAMVNDVEEVEHTGEDTVYQVRQKEERFRRVLEGGYYRRAKLLADAWCAAFVWRKTPDSPTAVSDSLFRTLDGKPEMVAQATIEEIDRLASAYKFFHWHLAFPGVFRTEDIGESKNVQTGWVDGFDVVLGNPPWEHTELKEKEFFAERRPEIASAPTGAERKRMIANLAVEDPAMYAAFAGEKRTHDGWGHFVSNSGRYPLCGRGRINTYAVFAELMHSLLSSDGRVGCIVPTGIATDDTTKLFFQELVESRALSSLFSFENEELIFPAIHHATKFCLLTFTGSSERTDVAKFVFYARQVGDLGADERRFSLSAEDIALVNPNTRTCPIFRSRRDAELTKAVFRRVPVLVREGAQRQNPWQISFRQGLFNMTSDSDLFRTRKELEADGWKLEGNVFARGKEHHLPLYEAKMIHHFDHRFGTYHGQTEAQANQGKLPELDDQMHGNPAALAMPRYWVSASEVDGALEGRWDSRWLLGFRDITSAVVARTVIGTIIPRTAVGHTLPVAMVSASPSHVAALVACISSFGFDYISRLKIGGTHLSFFIVNQLPVLSPGTYDARCPWENDRSYLQWILPRVIELLYTANDMGPFALDCGYQHRPFRWEPERRVLLRCELDAAFFHLYRISGEDVDYIMDSFSLVRERDEQANGEYRTKDMILEIYDEMKRSVGEARPYQTRLDPPPADPRCCHAEGNRVRE